MINPNQILLSAVGATGASGQFAASGFSNFTLYVHAATVTSGATIAFESLTPAGNWIAIDSRTYTANGDTVLQFSGAFLALRANVTAWTDGAYTASVVAS